MKVHRWRPVAERVEFLHPALFLLPDVEKPSNTPALAGRPAVVGVAPTWTPDVLKTRACGEAGTSGYL